MFMFIGIAYATSVERGPEAMRDALNMLVAPITFGMWAGFAWSTIRDRPRRKRRDIERA